METILQEAYKDSITHKVKIKRKDWFDEACARAIEERMKSREKMIKNNTEENRELFKYAQKSKANMQKRET